MDRLFLLSMIDKIEFNLFGYALLEPMAMITNVIVVVSCLFAFSRMKHAKLIYWRIFLILFALASFFGGLSHLFWNYWEFSGKITPWFFGVLATSTLTYAMVDLFRFDSRAKKIMTMFIVFKAVLILFLAYSNWNFLFVALDTIGSLLLACGLGSWFLYSKRALSSVRFISYGVLVMLPAAFAFLLRFDLHRWMNREDLSHLLIALGLLFFANFGKTYSLEEIKKNPRIS
jgi:hypothetical protein